MKTHDSLFLPYVTIVTEERDGEHFVVGCDVDWSDTFTNCWANNAAGHNAFAVVEDGRGPEDHPAAEEACAFLDAWLTGKQSTDEIRANGAALLRRLAELIEANPLRTQG